MLQGAAHEGSQPNGVGGHLGNPAAAAVGHLHVQGDELTTPMGVVSKRFFAEKFVVALSLFD